MYLIPQYGFNYLPSATIFELERIRNQRDRIQTTSYGMVPT